MSLCSLLSNIVLTVLGALYFHMHFRIYVLISLKKNHCWDFVWGCNEPIDWYWVLLFSWCLLQPLTISDFWSPIFVWSALRDLENCLTHERLPCCLLFSWPLQFKNSADCLQPLFSLVGIFFFIRIFDVLGRGCQDSHKSISFFSSDSLVD